MSVQCPPAPLAGIRVVELAQVIAGPSAGLLLAEYGAEVIKVEPPAGDASRGLRSPATRHLSDPPIFSAYNRDKTLVRLDLAGEEGREEAIKLIGAADILIEASRPGVMDRLGLGADALLARFPGLIYASVTGFGDGEAGRRRGGVDIVVQAESGMMELTGQPDGPPTRIGFTVVDAACGHALCHGILAALFQRSRIGLGSRVGVSLYDVALHLQTGPLAEYLATGQQPPRVGNTSPLAAPADLVRCREGQLMVSAYLESHWRRFVTLIGDLELLDDERFSTDAARLKNRDALLARIEQALAGRSAAEWADLFQQNGVLAGEVKTYREVLEDPITTESGVILNEPGRTGVANPVRVHPAAASQAAASAASAGRVANG